MSDDAALVRRVSAFSLLDKSAGRETGDGKEVVEEVFLDECLLLSPWSNLKEKVTDGAGGCISQLFCVISTSFNRNQSLQLDI